MSNPHWPWTQTPQDVVDKMPPGDLWKMGFEKGDLVVVDDDHPDADTLRLIGSSPLRVRHMSWGMGEGTALHFVGADDRGFPASGFKNLRPVHSNGTHRFRVRCDNKRCSQPGRESTTNDSEVHCIHCLTPMTYI